MVGSAHLFPDAEAGGVSEGDLLEGRLLDHDHKLGQTVPLLNGALVLAPLVDAPETPEQTDLAAESTGNVR